MMSNGKQSFIPISSQNENKKAKMSSKYYSEDESSDEEMLDLSKPLYPLSHYVDDEDELIAQIFSTMKHGKLKSIMPPVLKDIPLIYLQQLCLHELTGMSRNRVMAAINGEEMSSSSSDSDDSDDDEKCQNQTSDLKTEMKPSAPEVDKVAPMELDGAASSDVKKEGKGNLTALDLFELEMRAKVIKNMLGKDSNVESILAEEQKLPVNDIVIKQEPVSPIKVKSDEDRSRSSSRNSSRNDSMENKETAKRRDSSYSSSDRSRSRSRSTDSYSRSRSRSQTRSQSRSVSRGRSQSSSRVKNRSSSSDYSSDDSSKYSRERKGRKLTKKEFQERMKKAKMNRSYRKRNESDDDSYDELQEEINEKKYRKWKKKMEKKMFEKTAQWEKQYLEGLKEESKKKKTELSKPGSPADAEEGELADTEEGEVSSSDEKELSVEKEKTKEVPLAEQEEEEGACSASDVEMKEPKEEVFIEKITTYEDRPRKKRKKLREVSARKDDVGEEKASKRPRKTLHREIQEKSVTESNENSSMVDQKSTELDNSDSRMDEIYSEDNSRSENVNELPLKAARQSISFSLPKKGLAVSRAEAVAPASSSLNPNEQDSFSEEDFGAVAEDDNIELIGESSDETHPSTSLSGTGAPRAPSAADTDVPSPFDTKENTMDSMENSRDEKIDIIGVIETKDEDSVHAEDQDLLSGSSWSSRWLKSEKVQTVVTNTKLFGKVRKKIQMKKDQKKPYVTSKPSSPVPVTITEKPKVKDTQATQSSVIGSIEEYEKIIGVKLQAKTQAAQLEETLAMISDGSEDSEEEALWSQIMKK